MKAKSLICPLLLLFLLGSGSKTTISYISSRPKRTEQPAKAEKILPVQEISGNYGAEITGIEKIVREERENPELPASFSQNMAQTMEYVAAVDSMGIGNAVSENFPATIKIATFNIQVFGRSKRKKSDVMDVLTRIIRQYDVVAIQELRDRTETTLPVFLNQINSMPENKYNSILGPRLGRTSSKENYAFIYNTKTVSVASSYTYDDSADDLFEREPYIALFSSGDFGFVLINVHIKPDDAVNEINSLDGVIDDAKSHFSSEQDFIVLGDLNADCSYFPEGSPSLMKKGDYYWVVDDSADTTTKATDCAYDRIIFTRQPTMPDFTSSWGVFNFKISYGLTQNLAERVSDHYPVWAEFYTGRDDD